MSEILFLDVPLLKHTTAESTPGEQPSGWIFLVFWRIFRSCPCDLNLKLFLNYFNVIKFRGDYILRIASSAKFRNFAGI